MKISLSNVILIAILLLISFLYYSSFSEKRDLKTEITQLKNELKKEKETSNLYELTKTFIQKSSEAKHGDMLTGQAKQDYQQAIQNKEVNTDQEHNTVDHVDIQNVFVVKTKDEEIKSFAIYRVFYNNNPSSHDITTQRILDLTLIANWKKEKNQFKVSNYEINLLQDSNDKYLKELNKEKVNGG